MTARTFSLLRHESASLSDEEFRRIVENLSDTRSQREEPIENKEPTTPPLKGLLSPRHIVNRTTADSSLTQIESQQCSGCGHPLSLTAKAGESSYVQLAVNRYFHRTCLHCSDCNLEFNKITESKTRAQFYLISGKIYCNLHAQGRLKTCTICKDIIQDDMAVHIPKANQYYHKDCLICANPKCKKVLQNEKSIYVKEGKLFCKQHSASGEADSFCGVCKKSINGDVERKYGKTSQAPESDKTEEELVRSPLTGVIYHARCLKCSFCKVRLGTAISGPGFKPRYRNGRFFCQADYDLLTPKCCSCGHEILTKSVSAKNGQTFHEACFRCSICRVAVQKYRSFCGEIRCSEHRRDLPVKSLICFICHQPVRSSSAMSFAGEILHKKCFTCGTCNKDIKTKNGQIKATLGKDDDIHCWDCLRKAVGSGTHHTNVHHRNSSTSSEDASEQKESFRVTNGLKKLRNWLSTDYEAREKEEEMMENQQDANTAIRPAPELFDVSLLDSLSEEEMKTDQPQEKKVDPHDITAFFHKHEVTMMYDKGEKIGEGSFGKVYVCRRRPDNMLMAMKQIDLQQEDWGAVDLLDPRRNPKIRELLKEAQILGKLRHPNVVKFLGTQIDRNKKTLNIFMEYIPGRSMYGHLYEFGAYSEQAMKLPIYQILQGLKYLHSQGIIHRDLKSKNILISNRGIPKLADFGSAKMIDLSAQPEIGSALEASVQVCTPLYFPPEFVLNNVYTEKSDIWSLGCVMIEMVTARLPWSERKFDNEWAAARYIAQEDSIPQINAEVSDLCRHFITSCLNRDPKKRPSAEELLAYPFLKEVCK